MSDGPKKRLGRGLEALLSTQVQDGEGIVEIPVGELEPNPYQPRRDFDPEKLEELAASVREHGVIQPIIVRRVGLRHQIVAGERRWRAAQLAGRKSVPCLVRDFSDADTMQVALIENIQRQDLNPIEEARAFQILMSELGLTQEEVALRVGRSRPAISNALRLLSLDSQVQEWVAEGRLSAGHARAIAGLESTSIQREAARQVIERGLNVRQAEALARAAAKGPRSRPSRVKAETGQLHDLWSENIARQLQSRLGTRVHVRRQAEKGLLEIEFYGNEDLGRLFELIVGVPPQI